MVSIIVPNYNHAAFLSKRLESIFNQSFQHFEVILLDDASTDNSVDVLEQYAEHPKVSHFIINTQNSGSPFLQWQKGLHLAKGKYVWIAESDDWANLNFLERLVPTLEKNKNIGIAYAHSFEVDGNGNILKEREYLKEKTKQILWSNSFQMKGKDFLKRFMLERNVIPNASAVLFRKESLDLLDQRPFKLKKTGDWWIWSSILLKSDVYFVAQPLNYFRTHFASTRVYKNKQSRKTRILEGVEIVKLISTQVKIPKSRLNNIWKRLGNQWRRLYLYTSSIDQELFFPPFFQGQKIAYYLGFFAMEKKYYSIPYILLLPMRLLYLNFKK